MRGNNVEVTTMATVQDERNRYYDSVTLFDRAKMFWKEMTGHVEEDAPIIMELELLLDDEPKTGEQQ